MNTVASPAVPPKIRKISSVVVDIVQRTHDTFSLYFFTGETCQYQTGQFITIDPKQFPELSRWVSYYEKIKGKRELVRAYSMESIPSEKYVSICVKAEEYDPQYNAYPPLLSPLLASTTLKGREVVFTGFTGAYVLPEDHAQNTTDVLHVCSGSGIVPNYALLKDQVALGKNPSVKHTLIYVNKTVKDIIFHQELNALAEKYPDRFTLQHMITREDPTVLGSYYIKGRPTLERIAPYIKNVDSTRVFACGAAITKWQKIEAKEKGIEPTPRFMEGIEAILHELKVPSGNIKTEEYG